MGVEVVRPAVETLVFQVYARPLHPELFDSGIAETVHHRDQTITMRITAAGHAWLWSDGRRFVTEVLTDAASPLPERPLHARRLCQPRGPWSTRLGTVAAPLTYQAHCQVESLPPPTYRQVAEELLADAKRRGMLWRFAQGAVAPMGFVSLEAGADCLLVHAFHTFPDEFTIVKSQSLLEWDR